MARRIQVVAAIAVSVGVLGLVALRPGPGAPAPDLAGTLIAHRAGMAEAPENSLQAIRSAAEHGADGVELDIRAGPNGPVCAHDADQVPGAPTLEQALDLALSLGLVVELDLKTGALGSPGFVREVIDVVAGRSGVWVSAFHPLTLWWVRHYAPELPVGWPFVRMPMMVGAWWLRASLLEPRASLVTPERLARWHDAGWTVEVWTVDDLGQVKALREAGAAVVVNAVRPHRP